MPSKRDYITRSVMTAASRFYFVQYSCPAALADPNSSAMDTAPRNYLKHFRLLLYTYSSRHMIWTR